MDDSAVVWSLSGEDAAKTNTARFMAEHNIDSYRDLRARSVADPEWFWEAFVEFAGIPFIKPWRATRDTSRGHQWATWFVGGQFNMSQACVDRWADLDPDRVALKTLKETGERRDLTFAQLREDVGRLAGALRSTGVKRGDPVAVFLPMGVEAVVAFLAVARLGAVFIPVFSGYGAEAVAARLTQPRPSAIVCANGFVRKGQLVQMKEVVDEAVEMVGGVPTVIVVDYTDRSATPMATDRDLWWHEVVAAADEVDVVATSSEEPVLLAHTSGTTGRPKGVVHVQAGLTVKIAEEGAFQTELTPDDTVMWATDMGWIMGPWLVIAGLANGAAIATFDGAPNHPGPDRLWQVVEDLKVSFLGLSPTLVRALQPHGAAIAHQHDLSTLTKFGSTGEPWNPEPWKWLFHDVGGSSRPIINISGGTEIGACILSVNLLEGIKPTSLGSPALAMDADVYDSAGNPVRGEVGELILRGSWPGMTRGFIGEPERYLETYWSTFEDTWVHGDWASIDEDGFWYLHGRSDDTMNIAGKRIGPAEIESAAVALDEVVMAAAVGLPDETKGETIGLFVVAAPGIEPNDELTSRVVDTVVESMGKSFRPAMIRWVADLPRTRSAKIMRRLVRSIALGEDVGDVSTLENPESLEYLATNGRRSG